MSDLEEQLQEFESIQSIYDTDKLSYNSDHISKLVKFSPHTFNSQYKVIIGAMNHNIKFITISNASAINPRFQQYQDQT